MHYRCVTKVLVILVTKEKVCNFSFWERERDREAGSINVGGSFELEVTSNGKQKYGNTEAAPADISDIWK